MSISFFGKVRNEADFVRYGAGTVAAQAVFDWLTGAVATTPRDELPTGPVNFLFVPDDAAHAALGVLVPSCDRVGRAFPFVATAAVPVEALVDRLPAVLVSHQPFLEAATHQLAWWSGPEGQSQDLTLWSLPLPTEEVLRWAESAWAECLVGAAETFHARAFSGKPNGQHFYAYQTLVTACANRARNGGSAVRVLDCPVTEPNDVLAWIFIVQRILGRTPSIFWTDGPSPRLLISLGQVPPHMLQFIEHPPERAQALWPLTTEVTIALERAEQMLAPRLPAPSLSLGEYLLAVERMRE